MRYRLYVYFVIVQLIIVYLHASYGAILSYASANGEGEECTLASPCSIHTAASLFSGVTANQGNLLKLKE